MGVALYMDHHVPRSITVGLRMRGVDVITAQEDGAATTGDSELLDRALLLERVLFSRDDASTYRLCSSILLLKKPQR